MIGLRKDLPTEEQRAEQSGRRSAMAVDRHRRQRQRALLALSDCPGGSAPVCGVMPMEVLRALASRGLAECRYVLTPEGRREVDALRTDPA